MLQEPLPNNTQSLEFGPPSKEFTPAMADSSESTKRLIRVTVFNTRKAGLTNAQYVEHWLTVHQRIAAPWLVRAGFLEYRQVW